MSEQNVTYSKDLKDYKDTYNPETQGLMEIPGVGIYTYDKRVSDQELRNISDKISLSSDLHYANLHEDTALVDAWKRYYKRKEGENFEGDNKQAIDSFMSEFSYIDNNLSFGLGKTLINMGGLSEEEKLDIGLLYDRYDRTDSFGDGSRSFWDQTKDVAYAMSTDPFNYLGATTFGLGFAAKEAVGAIGGQAAKKALIAGFRNSVANKMMTEYGKVVAKHPIKAGAIGGAGWEAVYDIEKQNVALESGVRDERANILGTPRGFQYDDLLLHSIVGVGFGSGVGLLLKGARKLAGKQDFSDIIGKDTETMELPELKNEIEQRGLQVPTTKVVNSNTIKTSTLEEEKDYTFLKPDGEKVEVSFINSEEIPEKYNWESLDNDIRVEAIQEIEELALRYGDTVPYEIAISRAEREVAEKFNIEKIDKQVEYSFHDKEGNFYTARAKKDADIVQEHTVDVEADAQSLKDTLAFDNKATEANTTNIFRNPFNWLTEHFTSDFGVGKEAAELKRRADSNLTATTDRANTLIKKFEKEFKRVKKINFNDASKDVQKSIVRALANDKDPFSKADDDFIHLSKIDEKGNEVEWSELKDILQEWRNLIKNTSQDLLNTGAIPRMVKVGEKEVKNKLYEKIAKGIEQENYFNRLYRLYEDPEFEKDPRKALGEKEFNRIVKRYSETFNQTLQQATESVLHLASKSKNKKELQKLGSLSKRKIGTTEYDILLSEPLGPIIDPRTLFGKTIAKTKLMTEELNLKKDLVNKKKVNK